MAKNMIASQKKPSHSAQKTEDNISEAFTEKKLDLYLRAITGNSALVINY